MAFEGLLGGGDPLDLYGDLFTDKQRQALRQRELSSGLLSFAEKLGAASAPSRTPKGSFLGLLGQSLGGFAGGDEAANKQLEAMALAEKVRQSKSQRAFQEQHFDPLMLEWLRRRGLAGGAPGAAPAAPGAPPSAAPVAPAAAPPATAPPGPVPVGGVPGAYGAAGEYGVGQELPPLPGAPGQQNTGLLPPPPGAPDQVVGPDGRPLTGVIPSMLASYGGAPGGGLPFTQASATPTGAATPGAPRQGSGFNYGMLKKLALDAGFPPGDADIAAATWMGESSGNPFAKNVTSKEASYGLGQINARAHPGGEQAYGDPIYSARKSFELYQANKARGGSGFKDWTIYNTGAYKQHLPAVQAAAPEDYPDRPGGSGGQDVVIPSGRGIPRSALTNVADTGAAPGGAGQIPGLGIAAEDLALMNMLAKRSGLGEPFNSLLETYYKSPGYLAEAERTRTKAQKDVELQMDPLIVEQRKRAEYKVDTELKPALDAAVARAMNAPLQERKQAEADIDRITERMKQAQVAGTNIQEADIIGDDGKPITKKMSALEIATRERLTEERRKAGDLTPRPGDIVGKPVLTPEETAAQTQRGKSGQEMREVDVWTPTGTVKQTMSNQEIAAREALVAKRGGGGAPQIGDIISKPALTPADQKIADSLGEEFIATRKQALAADKTIRDTHNLRSKLDSGMFTGLDANFNLFMARLGDSLGWKNLSDPEKVKNTETYIAGLGSEVLAMVSVLRPASNIDLDFARQMAGGQNLSAASIRQLLDMREEYARLAIQRHNEEAAGRNPAIFQGARRELPMPPAYQPKELPTPSGNKATINR